MKRHKRDACARGCVLFEAHHIIPKNVLIENVKLQKLLDWAKANNKDFDFGGLDNGIMLQKRKKVNGDMVGDHANHPRYDDQFQQIFDDMIDENNFARSFDDFKDLTSSLKTQLTDKVVNGTNIVNDINIAVP